MFAFLYALLSVPLSATPLACPQLDIRGSIGGQLVLTFSDTADGQPAFACRVDSAGNVISIAGPAVGNFTGVNWGADSSEIMLSACDPARAPRPRCHVERTRIDGTLLRTYPDLPVQDFEEPDGRQSPGGVGTPARVSPTGEYIAAPANGRSPALLRAGDGKQIAGLTDGYSEASWSPDGRHLAFTASPDPGRSTLEESQVFIYDLASGSRSQLTHFPPESRRSWWNPFAPPLVRLPMVAGLSWARRADVIAFYVVPDRGVFLVDSQGKELHRLSGLEGRCWRLPQLSGDGQHLLYVSSSRPESCLLNGGDEIRITGAGGSDDHVVIRLRDPRYVITGLDWWTD
jgi:hypothetical protein